MRSNTLGAGGDWGGYDGSEGPVARDIWDRVERLAPGQSLLFAVGSMRARLTVVEPCHRESRGGGAIRAQHVQEEGRDGRDCLDLDDLSPTASGVLPFGVGLGGCSGG